jgi:hypothetical protein
MAISTDLTLSTLPSVASLNSVTAPAANAQSAQSAPSASPLSAGLAQDTYAAGGATSSSAATSGHPAPLYTTLNGQTLAQNQVISADLDVREALLIAGTFYRTPTEQSLLTLTNSLASGDIAGAQTALATYIQILPTAPESLSPLTAPSTQFLNDLTNLGSALQSGDLASARSIFKTAQYDAPDNITGAFAVAYDTGNTGAEATLSLEATQNDTGELISLGYTPVNAKIEANIIEIAAVAGLGTGSSQASSAQTNQLIIDLAKDVASGPQLTASQANDASVNPYYNIVTSLFALASPSELNKTLELLVSTYGTGGSDGSSNASISSNGGESADTAGVSAYA